MGNRLYEVVLNMRSNKMKQIDFDIIIKVLSGNANSAELDLFNEWINSSEENQSYYEQIRLILDQSKEAKKYSRIDMQKAWEKIGRKAGLPIINENHKRSLLNRNIASKWIKIAAIFIFAFGLGGATFYLMTNNKKIQAEGKQYYSTSAPLGSKSQIKLPDGSIVWLNSGSTIKCADTFEENEREVQLDGEAYFDVVKNADAPFYVVTNAVKIKVLGTRFNVKSYPEEGIIETTLEEGSVNLGKIGSPKTILLKPRQKAVFIKKEGKINDSDLRISTGYHKEQFIILEDVDTDLITSWKDNKLRFRSETFENLTVKLERWFNVKIHIENEKLKSKIFSGSFGEENIEQVMKALQVTLSFDFTIDKNNVWIK